MPIPQFGVTVQNPRGNTGATSAIAASMAGLFTMTVIGSITKAPPWWSIQRDDWLVDFVKREANDLLAGALATVTAKIVANSWYIEGPLMLATLYRRLLLHESDFGRGWDSLLSKWVGGGYLNRDAGGIIEAARASRTDFTGPALGFHHIDESKMVPTGDPILPFEYISDHGPIPMHRSQICHIIDMPSGKEENRGIGFCSVSRALTTAHILMDIVRYKRERLSDLMPAGLLLINNIGHQQWTDLNDEYDARQHNQGNRVWRDVMIALGVDPAYPISAEFIEYSQLPEGYDEKIATETAVYTFALAFREDPREFWPVSSGPLGTATEAELQARSARIKGEGIIATAIERQLNRPDMLPEGVKFHFDYQDDEQDKLAAEIANLKSQTIRRLWEPASFSQTSFNPGGAPQGPRSPNGPNNPALQSKAHWLAIKAEEAEANSEEPNNPEDEAAQADYQGGVQTKSKGIITTEQALAWLIRDRIIPWDVVGQPMDVERLYDTKAYMQMPGWGPRVRLYKDGRCFKWE